MFLSVIAAYVIATAFAFCGLVNMVGYIMESQQGMGSFVFIEGLALAMWPLAVAMALVMLVQIACLLERWLLLWTMAQTPATPAPPAAPKAPAPKAAPAASPRPSPLAAATPPVMQDAAPAPLPVPQKPEAAESPIPLPPKPAPRQEGLNFFKLD